MSPPPGASQGASAGRGGPGARRGTARTRRLPRRTGMQGGIRGDRAPDLQDAPRAEHCGVRGTTRTWSPWSYSPRTSRCPWGGEVGCREERVPSVPTPGGSHLPRSGSCLSRGSDADLSLRGGVTLGAALPRTGGLGSLQRGQKGCHHLHAAGWQSPQDCSQHSWGQAEPGGVPSLPPTSPCHLPRGCCVPGGQWSAGQRLRPALGDTGSGFSLGIAAGAAQALLQPQPQPPHLVLQRPDGLAAPGQMSP